MQWHLRRPKTKRSPAIPIRRQGWAGTLAHRLVPLFLSLLPVLASDPMPAVRARQEAGDTRGALRLLEEFENRNPELFERNRLPYLKARLLLESGRKQEAETLLSRLDWKTSPLGDAILESILEASQGRPLEEWRAPLVAFLENYPGHPSWSRWALVYADSLKEREDLDEALTWYNRVWRARAGSSARRAALEHARMHLLRNDPAEAIRDLQNLIKKNERDDVAVRAALQLDELLPPEQASESGLRRRAVVLMNNRRTRLAREYLEFLSAHFPDSLSAPHYAYLKGRSFVFDGQLEKAYQTYVDCYARFPASDSGVFCKYQAGNTALRKLSYDAAVRDYREFLEAHPDNRRAARVAYNLADTYRWLGDDEKAEQTALAALKTVAGPERNQFHYYLARMYFEQDRFPEALTHLAPLHSLSSRQLPSGVTREEIQYFKGVSLNRSGEPESASRAFLSGSSGSPNYFGYLCRERLGRQPAHSSQGAEWLDLLISPRPFYQSADQVPSAPFGPLARARELLFLGLPGEASRAIQQGGRRAFPDVGAYLFNVAFYADQGGLPRESLLAAEQLRNSRFRGTWPDQLPTPVRELVYPRHYWSLVQEEGRRSHVDPHLLLAVIYQESRFDPAAKSSASARGLMQFLETPARRLAAELELSPPTAADLYRPDLSIRLGAYHLRKLLRRHGDSIEQALAAYNGGSDNARRWAAKGEQSQPEHFVANIGFRETKLYVLKVMGNYRTYQILYGSNPVPFSATQ